MNFAIIEGDVTLRSGGVELAVDDATALPASTRGFIGVGYDGTNTRFIRVDSSGYQVIVGAGTAGTPAGGVLSIQGVSGGQAVPVSGTFWQATQPVSSLQLPAALVGGRLDNNIGAWFGATTPTVGQKAMAASIPIAIASDQSAIPASQSGTWTVQQGTPPWKVEGTDADGAAPTENPVLVAGQDGTNVQTLKTDTTGHAEVVGPAADGATPVGNPVLSAGQDGTNVQSLKTDTTGRQEVVGGAADGAVPAGNPVLAAGWDGTNVEILRTNSDGRLEPVLVDSSGNEITVTQEGAVYRLEVTGKVSVVGALPPPATTAFAIFADTPLTTGNHDTTWTIPSGEAAHIQSVQAGNEDPTKGAVVEIIFDDGTEHLVERVYINGQTITISFGDVMEARDGTDLIGNGSNELIVRRTKYSGTNIAIDAVLRGYY